MPGHDPGALRGRRDPELQGLLDAEQLMDDESDGVNDPEEYVLLDGDSLMSKITLETETAMGNAWVTFGVQTRVMQGETEEHAFNRLATITNSRAVHQLQAVDETMAEVARERAEELRQTRINPRQH